MPKGSKESFRQESRGLAKVIQRNKIPKDTPREDPRAFGRRIAAEVFEQAVKEAETRTFKKRMKTDSEGVSAGSTA